MFFDDSTLDDYATVPRKGARRFEGVLKRLMYAPVRRQITTFPFALPVGSECTLDTECFKNYWLAAFKHLASGQYFFFELSPDSELDRDGLLQALFWFKVLTFNGNQYDIPMIEAAHSGLSTFELKEKSDDIILRGERPKFSRLRINHVDLIEVAPLEASLKAYAARLHCKRMQELSVDVHGELTREEAMETRDYCFNDLDNTELLYDDPKWGLRQYIELRERLSARYPGVDLRSKSDAQVAEAVINAELKALTGRYPKRPEFDEDFSFMYEAPAFIQFQTPLLQDVLSIVQGASFYLDGGGSPRMPDTIADLSVTIGGSVYKMGMGGLHSNEKSTGHVAGDDCLLLDTDVASYYPRIILNNRYFPEHLGPVYLEAYGGVVDLRLALKAAKDPLEAGLKIAINGTFGKQGNMYSTIYAPKLLIQTTMTGQLSLLLLIEAVELAGIPVVSANTDGFVVKCPKSRYEDFIRIVRMWEDHTGFQTEETRYSALYSRDVNNYIAVKEDGTCKVKGAYSEKGSALNSPLSKNPETLICSDAVQAFLTTGARLEDTIRASRDIRRFVVIRNVRGGAHKDGWFLGKVVRWYYAEGVTGTINYIVSGNKVANSEGAKPLMEMDEFPADLDFDWYVQKAYSILEDIGYHQRPKQARLF